MNPATLRHLSLALKKSDRQIAEIYGLSRSTIGHRRKRWGITKPKTLGRLSEELVLKKLTELGRNPIDMNAQNLASEFDIQLENGLRIEVKGSNYCPKLKRYTFSFSNPPRSENKLSKKRISIKGNRTYKSLPKHCDYVVLVGHHGKQIEYWVVPAYAIPIKNTLQLYSNNPIHKYKNNWNALKELSVCSI